MTYCSTCGNTFDPAFGSSCPQCSSENPSFTPPREEKLWRALGGLLTWFASVVLLLGFQFVAAIIYFAIIYKRTGEFPQKIEIDWLLAMLSVVSTFPAHILTLVVAWFVVTARGARSFWRTLGWGWHPQFKWVHAVALAFLMMGVAVVAEKLLPHKETDLEKLLKLGTSIRWAVAALAVLTAPLVEEVIYRGVLYAGIERTAGKTAGVALVTFLFAMVHVPQYWGSYAAITVIVSLSLVLTLLRAWTGKLLPCVATHLVYNSVQAVALLVGLDKLPDAEPQKTAMIVFTQWLGLN